MKTNALNFERCTNSALVRTVPIALRYAKSATGDYGAAGNTGVVCESVELCTHTVCPKLLEYVIREDVQLSNAHPDVHTACQLYGRLIAGILCATVCFFLFNVLKKKKNVF